MTSGTMRRTRSLLAKGCAPSCMLALQMLLAEQARLTLRVGIPGKSRTALVSTSERPGGSAGGGAGMKYGNSVQTITARAGSGRGRPRCACCIWRRASRRRTRQLSGKLGALRGATFKLASSAARSTVSRGACRLAAVALADQLVHQRISLEKYRECADRLHDQVREFATFRGALELAAVQNRVILLYA